MYQKHIIGQEGEDIACKYLLQNQYEIIERNFECRQGEIDIIAIDKNELVFIEVKTRTNNNYGRPAEAVTYYKQKHLLKSIEYYIFKRKIEKVFIRIDVIEVYNHKGKNYIHHIKNAISKN